MNLHNLFALKVTQWRKRVLNNQLISRHAILGKVGPVSLSW